jgi:hypothetical protein
MNRLSFAICHPSLLFIWLLGSTNFGKGSVCIDSPVRRRLEKIPFANDQHFAEWKWKEVKMMPLYSRSPQETFSWEDRRRCKIISVN